MKCPQDTATGLLTLAPHRLPLEHTEAVDGIMLRDPREDAERTGFVAGLSRCWLCLFGKLLNFLNIRFLTLKMGLTISPLQNCC